MFERNLYSLSLTAAVLFANVSESNAASSPNCPPNLPPGIVCDPLPPSPNGTTIPPAANIIDSKGIVWTVANGKYPGESFENGVFDNGWNITLLLYYNSIIYAQVTDGSWYTHASGSWQYDNAGDPRPSTSLYMRYQVSGNTVGWSTCGSANGSSGCFGSGQLGSFGHVCAITGRNGNVYVADTSGSNGSAQISIYQQTVGVTSSNTLLRTISLPVSADNTATCSMAATNTYLYFGTNKSNILSVQLKSPYTVTTAPTAGFGPALSITANDSFAIINQTDSGGSPNTLFSVIDSNNRSLGDGGESSKSFLVEGNTVQP